MKTCKLRFISEEWSKTTGRSVLNYHLNEDIITYLSYSTGYKSGGFDALNPGTAFKPIRPELATSLELGLKGDFFESRLRGQFSYFDMELVDRQKSVSSADSDNGIAIPTIINGTQDTTGFELKMQWVALETLRIGFSTTVREVESIWDEFQDANGDIKPENSIFFQFELKGFTSLGDKLDDFLLENISGYRKPNY